MLETLAPFLIPAGFACLGVLIQQAVARRKNSTDDRYQMIAVLQAERATADARADKAEQRAAGAESRARRFETLAWKYYTIIQRAELTAPDWPTDETTRVTA